MPERSSGGMLQMLHLTLRVGGVNALWLLAIGLSALPMSLFNIAWHRHPQVKANGLLVNLLLAAAVLRRGGDQLRRAGGDGGDHGPVRGVSHRLRASGKLWFALGRLGTLLMAWSCWLVWSSYGTLELAQINQQAVDMPQNPLLWLPGWSVSRCWPGRSRCTAGRRRLTPGPARRPPRCFPRW
jgi:formate hydrogenlyase subunit 3